MNIEEIIKKQMENVITEEEAGELSKYADNISMGLSQDFTLDKILKATLNGESIFDSAQLIESLKELFFYEIKCAIGISVEIIGICIILGILKNLSSSLGKKSVSEIAMLTCTIIIAGITLNNFKTVCDLVTNTMETTTYTMEILLPVLIGILISMGQITSGTIMNPLLLSCITIFQSIIKNGVIPLLYTSTILILLNSLTEKDYVNKLSKFLKSLSMTILGIIITIMSGIVAIQGLITKTSDSLIVGTAKYSLDAFIPIVGGFASDTVELFIKCMSSIKGIVGIFGIILLITMLLSPVLKILSIAVIYKITALLMEPISTPKISKAVNEVGGTLISMGSILFFSGLLFIIFITSIVNIGGV